VLLLGGSAIALIVGGGSLLLWDDGNVQGGPTTVPLQYCPLQLYTVPVLILAMVHFVAWQLYIHN
jgi:hypothetical protein